MVNWNCCLFWTSTLDCLFLALLLSAENKDSDNGVRLLCERWYWGLSVFLQS